MLLKVLAPAALLVASATSQETSEAIFSVQTDTTNFLPSDNGPGTTEGIMSILPIPDTVTPTITDASGIMSIPQGETPITTGLSSSGEAGGTTPTPSPSEEETSSPGGTASDSAPAEESTGAAAPGRYAADGAPALFAAALSGLSITLGFAWTLL